MLIRVNFVDVVLLVGAEGVGVGIAGEEIVVIVVRVGRRGDTGGATIGLQVFVVVAYFSPPKKDAADHGSHDAAEDDGGQEDFDDGNSHRGQISQQIRQDGRDEDGTDGEATDHGKEKGRQDADGISRPGHHGSGQGPHGEVYVCVKWLLVRIHVWCDRPLTKQVISDLEVSVVFLRKKNLQTPVEGKYVDDLSFFIYFSFKWGNCRFPATCASSPIFPWQNTGMEAICCITGHEICLFKSVSCISRHNSDSHRPLQEPLRSSTTTHVQQSRDVSAIKQADHDTPYPPPPTPASATRSVASRPSAAYTKDLAITLARVRTVNGCLAKDDMPRILKHSARQTVVQLRVQQPLTKPDVVLARSAVNCFAGDGELGAAGCGNDFGDRNPREDLLEGGFENVRERRHFSGILIWADCGRTAREQGAAKVDVARGLDVGGLDVLESHEGVVVGAVIVPGEALRVDEDGGGGKGVVAVDEMTEVR